MKITPAWLAEGKHCPDGLAFALSALPPDGLEIEKCWPLMNRPDWIVSLAVQAKVVSIAEARWMVERTLLRHAEVEDDVVTLGAILLLNNSMSIELRRLRVGLASEVNEAIVVRNNLAQAHRLNCVGQFAASDDAAFREGDVELALTRLQGAAFSLGLSQGMTKTADLLKERMVNLLGTKKGSELARI